MNTTGKLFCILCLFMFTLGGAYAQEENGEAAAPLWKMAFLKKSGSAYESVPFRQNLTMRRNDAYRVYLAFEGAASCYVIQEDDEGKLPLVYKKAVSRGDSISLPEDVLGNGAEESRDFKAASLLGTSRLYVIVSDKPRQHLEKLIEQYEKESDALSLERSLLSEVLAIRRSLSSLPETSVPPTETDPAMKGQLWLFEGRDAWVVTITVRVQ